MRNVYIIGPQSTGKSTLVDALEASFKAREDKAHSNHSLRPLVIREIARAVLQEKGYHREDITKSPSRALQLQQHILEAQYNAESEAETSGTPSWYICDRSGLDPIVYARYFVGSEASAAMLASTTWLDLEKRMKAGIVVLCEAGCHWLIDDGVRLMPRDAEEWFRIDDAFRDLLRTRDISYSIVPKEMAEITERVSFVEGLIDASYN